MSINVNLQDRQVLLLTVALGMLVLDATKRIHAGESTALGGQDVTPLEIVELIEVIRNQTNGAAPTADPGILSDREKFLLGGALGALFFQMDSAVKGPEGAALVSKLKLEVLTIANKMDLKQGALNGAGEFLRSLN